MRRQKFPLFFILIFVFLALGGEAMASTAKNRVERAYYSNGRVRLEVRYKNGEPVSRKLFSPEGRLLEERRFKNGEMYFKRSFYPNGRIRNRWDRKNQKLAVYSRDGKKRTKINSQ